MLRTVAWAILWIFMLCAPTIRVTYADGLTINLNGWM